jgi:hypothetical protein
LWFDHRPHRVTSRRTVPGNEGVIRLRAIRLLDLLLLDSKNHDANIISQRLL